jgi:Amt family ammonium transporter
LWSTFVYAPVAHWVWAEGGWLSRLGALDFAGGTVVYVTAGASTLVCSAFAGAGGAPTGRAGARRTGGQLPGAWKATLAGAGLLWLACVGQSEGSAVAMGRSPLEGLNRTQIAAAAGAVASLVVAWGHGRRPTVLDGSRGLVAGLVSIMPAAGYVSPSAALAIGFIAGALRDGTALGALWGLFACILAITSAAGYVAPSVALAIAGFAAAICIGGAVLRARFVREEAADAFGAQGIAGLAGVLLTGVFARRALDGSGANGALFGHVGQIGIQWIACMAIAAYASLMTYLLLKGLKAIAGPLRATGSSAGLLGPPAFLQGAGDD